MTPSRTSVRCLLPHQFQGSYCPCINNTTIWLIKERIVITCHSTKLSDTRESPLPFPRAAALKRLGSLPWSNDRINLKTTLFCEYIRHLEDVIWFFELWQRMPQCF
jgi:hypothetical protein